MLTPFAGLSEFGHAPGAASTPPPGGITYLFDYHDVDNTVGPVDTTGTNLLVVAVADFNAQSFSDSAGNTWTQSTRYQTGVGALGVVYYYCANPTTSASHSFTYAGGFAVFMDVIGVSGANATPFDSENGTLGGGATIQPGSVTPSVDGCLIVTLANCFQATGYSINSGFATVREGVIADGVSGGFSYLIQLTAAPINPTFSYSNNQGFNVANIAVFKPA